MNIISCPLLIAFRDCLENIRYWIGALAQFLTTVSEICKIMSKYYCGT